MAGKRFYERGFSTLLRSSLGSFAGRIISDIILGMSDLKSGEGKIIVEGGKKVAAYNDGVTIKKFSTACPHLGCDIEWNSGEKTWDCPCHGSRFKATGEVIQGPAKRALDSAEINLK